MTTLSLKHIALEETVDETSVAIFAYQDRIGRPMAWPVTPYLDGEKIVVTSTLAFIRKAQHVRRNGRVSILAGGLHVTGIAEVSVDVTGDSFAERFLEQELRKYSPAKQIVSVPFHRTLFSWYFGRVFMTFKPLEVREVSGDDRHTLITLDEAGFPRIAPVGEPARDANAFATAPLAGPSLSFADGPATILGHDEPTMSDLRQEVLRGDLRDSTFSVQTRIGTLDAPRAAGWFAPIKEQLDFHRRARKSRRIIRDWQPFTSKQGDGNV